MQSRTRSERPELTRERGNVTAINDNRGGEKKCEDQDRDILPAIYSTPHHNNRGMSATRGRAARCVKTQNIPERPQLPGSTSPAKSAAGTGRSPKGPLVGETPRTMQSNRKLICSLSADASRKTPAPVEGRLRDGTRGDNNNNNNNNESTNKPRTVANKKPVRTAGCQITATSFELLSKLVFGLPPPVRCQNTVISGCLQIQLDCSQQPNSPTL
ncbi:hypothetical protein EYF80_021842 [Liparis tanakae]|uniref:Uncharacterized protein n=1 Tax=Liparis tanakae TaxID=230148 RepID=A0A4Z2HSB3_9TELE|nr:hypothetical protein EYF80_021842 [Liparis tanakae]